MKELSCNDEPDMTETYEWLLHLYSKGRKPNTLHTHCINVRLCLRSLKSNGRSEYAGDITTDDIQFLWRSLKVKESVRRAYLRSLSGMVMYHTGADIVKKSEILYNREVCDRVFITKEEFVCAYRNANQLQRLILCLGAYMGLRRVEMAGIRDCDIDGKTMTIHGKGHGEDGLVAKVRIPAPVLKAISDYRGSPMKEGPRSDDYLLQNRGKDGVLHRMELNKITSQMTVLGKKMGFTITTHSLRRFYATIIYYDTKSDLQTLRSMMRHANIATTLKCYVNAYDEKERETEDELTAILDNLVRNV